LEWEESASIQMMKLYISQKTGKVGMPAAFVCRPAMLLDASRLLAVFGAAAEVVNMHRQCMASCVTTCIRSKVTAALRPCGRVLTQDVAWVDERLRELVVLLPDIVAKLPVCKADLILALASDTQV